MSQAALASAMMGSRVCIGKQGKTFTGPTGRVPQQYVEAGAGSGRVSASILPPKSRSQFFPQTLFPPASLLLSTSPLRETKLRTSSHTTRLL